MNAEISLIRKKVQVTQEVAARSLIFGAEAQAASSKSETGRYLPSVTIVYTTKDAFCS